ncbi:group II intron reverse transcriptase/maturase [Desulforamulus hydrothermalis]|uniref:Retron-type reverse transcriptase n=1 Tax=Desulforamulus hydrothermalis Lam5 = DSM 18033 TaxID=1121428 RepID=K8DY21_9FIRM|nr:group II intron reverse transcriptase/maturase [Desulforamulus hydrothermalis]CCO07550.1 Retron-type reverse transcriptase [Desulforamulus hydrothermalis Lam5 = DSM 18033]SHH31151.1 RNA-directed DNA polymerase [Desulforamulus hydrothermalis Lam5 = DSM 18033]
MKKWYSLIDKVYRIENLEKAYKAVRANKGAPGADGVTVKAYGENLEERLSQLHYELKTGTYEPQPVLRVEIPKPDGSKRPLGIPTVKDRVVQQALLNILQPIFEPDFHPSSYGYRPNRSCHQAVAKAEMFINKYGLEHVVDMDLSKCFDRLDHELILKGVARKVSDGKVLKLISKFLTAGVMKDGAWEGTDLGSPQGGVISPLLTNIYLDHFDQAMKNKGIRIVRYADDILIFGKTLKEAKQYKRIATEILEGELKLTVNREKTHITNVSKGVAYLGFIIRSKFISINPKKIKSIKDKIKKLTPRNHGMNIEEMIRRLNPVLRGWSNYFRVANCKKIVEQLMEWIRRRLRMKQMREWKSWKQLHKALRRRGYKGTFEKISMQRWRNSASPLINMALPNKWFDEMGLIDLTKYSVGILHHFWEK